jgi:hypothetical protein
MAIISNREQRLYIATICLSVITVLLAICLMIVGILWYMDKKNFEKSLRQRVGYATDIFTEKQKCESELKNLKKKVDDQTRLIN